MTKQQLDHEFRFARAAEDAWEISCNAKRLIEVNEECWPVPSEEMSLITRVQSYLFAAWSEELQVIEATN